LLFHNLAQRYAEVLESIQRITGRRFRRVYIMGGGNQNEVLNRLTGEATGLEVVRAGTECSTLGNFAVQLATMEGHSGPGRARPSARWAKRLKASAR
jgi:rhamnulokinase